MDDQAKDCLKTSKSAGSEKYGLSACNTPDFFTSVKKHLMKHLLFLLALLCFSVVQAHAQRTLNGKVTNAEGEALAGVSVASPGQPGGTSTDETGTYRLNVPNEATLLRFSYTGYMLQELPLGVSNVYDVVLQPSANTLQELIVVGYGTQQKRDLTGNVATVKGDDLPDIPAQSFDQLLQGRAAGVNVSLPNGVLNNPPVFRIRGINSISLSSYPLIVIDGVPSFTGDLSSPLPAYNHTAHNVLSGLNPADIESIDILKDAAAAAIYGSRAAAGVVLITTKSGRGNRARVSYNAWMGWSEPVRLPDMLNARQYVEIKNEGARNAGLSGEQFFLDSIDGRLIDTRWFDLIYRTGFSHNQNLSFSGSSNRTDYYISLEYSEQEGIIRKNNFDRLGGRFNINHRFGQHFRVGSNVSYNNIDNQSTGTGSVPGQAFNGYAMGRIAIASPPNVGPYLANGEYNGTWPLGTGKNLQFFSYPNAVPLLDRDLFTNEVKHLQASAFAELEPWKGLVFRSQYGLMDISSQDLYYESTLNNGYGYIYKTLYKDQRWNWQTTTSFGLDMSGHRIDALAGNEQQFSELHYFGAERYNAADPFFSTIGGNYLNNTIYGQDSRNFLLSWFGRLSYGFDNKYLLTANIRQDEYSAFASGNQKGTFWGISGGWVLSEEAFWKTVLGSRFNYVKLRGSYGEVGNNTVGDYAARSLYASGINGSDATLFFAQAGNPDLSWETSKKTDIGIQFGLLKDRLQGEYTWFKTLNDGLLLQAPQPASLGIPGNAIAANIGSMQNKGHEIGLSGLVLEKGAFSWRSSLNVTFIQNEVLSLTSDNVDIYGITSDFELSSVTRVGESVGSIFVIPTQGVNPQNGQRIFVKSDGTLAQYSHPGQWTLLSDGSPTSGVSVLADGKVYGPAIPKWYGGWENVFQYRDFDLNLQLTFSGGNYVYNGTKAGLRDQRWWNNHTDVLDRWSESNTDGSIPRVVFGDNVSNGSALPISENVEKGDYLRVRNITLGYRLPATLLGRARISGLRFYANINNAWLFTGYSGTDPEISTNGNSNLAPGVERNSAPMSRSFTIGLNLNI